MAKHFCLKEYVNGYELSVSIDDNLCDKFRAEIILFGDPRQDIDMHSIIREWGCRSVERMAECIIEAEAYAMTLPPGKFGEFNSYISI